MKVPLFPLSSHVLPEGRMALRIFEPRYTRMVKEVCESDGGFVVCMINHSGDKSNNTHIFPLGTYCKVIDFDILDDGLLGVTIEGKHCVAINDVETQFDDLRVATCEPSTIWTCESLIEDLSPMNDRLREIFEKYPEVSDLYDTTKFDDPVWVVNRWLELLPVDAEQKQHFMAQQDCDKVVKYLSQLIE
ncbi:LON peptidase substrate-binding domain-containing protein [Glaciecola sp. XM2]|uniref:LON peptidase substrate-binding domain-containing protein n=1 Tax=Glaciecola sp. XM2 TaxID=1914931 RepID=UPI001BDEA0FA|nr:LON peptidase substrate-binding domain-containing protein [Glaciecola sp. XM2]MBT1452283.1 LON peptidase substrate-binding domain-containing protein [Glaciecola sp. XM2]